MLFLSTVPITHKLKKYNRGTNMAHQTIKPKLETSFKLVSQIPESCRVRKKILRNTKNIEEKNVTPNNIARLMQAIYDDAANAYKKACKTGDKERQQECLRQLYFIENQFGKIGIWTALEARN